MQVEQLELNKAKMTEVHGELQKQLAAALREVREAREAASSHEDVTELHETIEMLTLDKEMAEEKRDQLEREMENLKDKHEEVSLELEVLQHEVAEGGKGEASTNFRVVELQKQKDKLTDALIKLRDQIVEDKHEKLKMQKEIKSLEERNEELNNKVEALQKEFVRTEDLILNLQEQVSVLSLLFFSCFFTQAVDPLRRCAVDERLSHRCKYGKICVQASSKSYTDLLILLTRVNY